ncbi:hypothetical protein [Flammeovirga sp. OC4]|nr:hypothetical protein [Flammeovirga sp. OC4]
MNRAILKAVFLPMPGSFEISSTAFSKDFEGRLDTAKSIDM